MKIPIIQGVIRSRLLVNYRVRPVVLGPLLPTPFRPKLSNGFGIAGICLIRLVDLRPAWMPSSFGLSVDSAAHRVAVEWDEGATARTGVFVFRRDCASRLIRLLGGRAFPGVHSKAELTVFESDDRLSWDVRTRDGIADLSVVADLHGTMPPTSALTSLGQARDFFAEGACGYSPQRSGGRLDGMKLCIPDFDLKAAHVTSLRSSFYENVSRFPKGTIEFDSAFVMKKAQHHWQVIGEPPKSLVRVG